MKLPLIIVIVITYNGKKWINRCFGSLLNSSIPVKILAIDNLSDDGTPEIIKNKFPEVETIINEKNLGFGKANNIGLKYALGKNADFVFLLNQDAWIEPNTIERLIKIYEKNKQFAILAPLQLNGLGSLIDKDFYKGTICHTRNLTSDILIKKQLNEVYVTPFINGACWLLPKGTLLKFGGFDPLYTHYGEDDDYINRVHQHNQIVGICPSILVYHDRENRENVLEVNNYSNQLFVQKLSYLKKSNPSSKLIIKLYFKRILIIPLSLFSSNKFHYNCELTSITKLLKIYRLIIDNVEREKKLGPHYL